MYLCKKIFPSFFYLYSSIHILLLHYLFISLYIHETLILNIIKIVFIIIFIYKVSIKKYAKYTTHCIYLENIEKEWRHDRFSHGYVYDAREIIDFA